MIRLIEYLAVRGFAAALQAVPLEASRRVARGVAWAVCRLARAQRLRAVEHLRTYGRFAHAEELAEGVFETIGRHVAEVGHIARKRDLGLRIEGADLMRREYARGKGVVLVSAHFGSFTLVAATPRLVGYKAAAIMKKQKNMRLIAWCREFFKRSFDVNIVLKTEVRDLVADLLRQGYAVGFFADQHPRGGGFPATFFGHPVVAAAGPAIYAKRCGSPIVVLTIAAQPDGTHVVRFEPVSSEGSLAEVSGRWMAVLEARIREHPEQWLWMHRRWRASEESREISESSPAVRAAETR